MADKKISELDLALQINNDAVFPMSQDNAGEPTTFKAGITQLGTEIAEDMTFSNLRTTSKKLVGAINELLSLGNPIILGTSAPTSSIGADGNLYVQYTAGTGGADDEVDGIFVKINGAWCEIRTGGGGAGGHTIVDNAGTDLAQRTNLQFKGAYSEDNSADDTTEVNVVRSMTKAEFNQLSAAEKVGFINTTDEASQINATEIPIESGSTTNTKDYIDNKTASDIEYSSGVTVKQKIDSKADISTTCKYIQTTLTWNANTNRFDIPSQSPRPVQPQQCLIGRNSSTGALYALWYVSTDENFSLGAVLSGNAPTSGQTCYINYVIPNT